MNYYNMAHEMLYAMGAYDIHAHIGFDTGEKAPIDILANLLQKFVEEHPNDLRKALMRLDQVLGFADAPSDEAVAAMGITDRSEIDAAFAYAAEVLNNPQL